MAIPFNLPVERDGENHQYLRIENLLRELLTLLRWTPWLSVTTGVRPDPSTNNNSDVQRRAGIRQQSVRAQDYHHRSSYHRIYQQQQQQQQPLDQQERQPPQPQRQQQEQQQLPLPDLIASCPMPSVEVVPDDKFTKTVTLQVELCPKCYYSGRKLKVVGVTKLNKSADDNQLPQTPGMNRHGNNDEEPRVDVEDCSKVKRRLMSLLQPSKIDSSILTAVFVIIGWKMFIKQ